MKSRVIYLYWLTRRNSIYLFIVIFILCYSCSPSKYGHALNCQNLYVEMGGKDDLEAWLLMVQSRVGSDPGIRDDPFASVWDGIAFINDGVTHVQKSKAYQEEVMGWAKQVDADQVAMLTQVGDAKSAIAQLQARVAEGDERGKIMQFLKVVSDEQRSLTALCTSGSGTGDMSIDARGLHKLSTGWDCLKCPSARVRGEAWVIVLVAWQQR